MKRTKINCNWNKIPDDLWIEIFLFLCPKDKVNFLLSCKRFYNLRKVPYLNPYIIWLEILPNIENLKNYEGHEDYKNFVIEMKKLPL